MTVRHYNRQHVAAYAAGFINADGTTAVTTGLLGLTRIASGQYGAVLGADDELGDRETFTVVTIKGTDPRFFAVEDTSDRLKTIRTFDVTPTLFDNDIEVAIFRTLNNNL